MFAQDSEELAAGVAQPSLPVVAIVGGGFCGTMTAYHLLRLAAQGDAAPMRVMLIERDGPAGCGVAYSTSSPVHVLNVVAERMSPLADAPDHFYDWARQRGRLPSPVQRDSFLPRWAYGVYLRELLAGMALQASRCGSELVRVGEQATDIAPASTGYTVSLQSGRAVRAHAVVLALGNAAPSRPAGEGVEALLASPGYVPDPWAPGALESIGPDERVLVLGTGLTMIDVVLHLAAREHRAPIVAVSRRGVLPSRHHMRPPYITPDIDVSRFRTLADARRALRVLIREVEAAGGHWTQVLAALRQHTGTIWSAWSPDDQRRFLRRLSTYWNAHRHRVPPRSVERIAELSARGGLTIRASRRLAWRAGDGGLHVRFGDGEEVACDRVVNCTGPDADVRRWDNPLTRNLLQRGWIVPDPLALGVQATDRGEVIDCNGAVQPGLLTLGGWLRPNFWESTAVQELREQAVVTAELAWKAACLRWESLPASGE